MESLVRVNERCRVLHLNRCEARDSSTVYWACVLGELHETAGFVSRVSRKDVCFLGADITVQGRLRTNHLGYPHSLVTGKTRNR